MKVVGIDISSKSTGIAVIEDDKLLDYTKINPTGTMSNSAKMFLFHVELEKFLNKFAPDYIAVEDVIQVSSVSVTKILARFNGIALMSAYKINKKEPKLFIPGEWKKAIGLPGSVRKCQTQIFVCKKYDLLNENKIKYYEDKINSCLNADEIEIEQKRENLESLNKKKRKEKDKIELARINGCIEQTKKEILALRKSKKALQDKQFDELSMEIYVETGINEDIADSIGVALAYQKELK